MALPLPDRERWKQGRPNSRRPWRTSLRSGAVEAPTAHKYIKIYLSAPVILSIHMGGIYLFYACYLHKLPGSLPSIIFSMGRMQCEKSNMTFLRLRVSYKQKQKPKRYIPFLRLRVFGNIRKMKSPDFFYACGYVEF